MPTGPHRSDGMCGRAGTSRALLPHPSDSECRALVEGLAHQRSALRLARAAGGCGCGAAVRGQPRFSIAPQGGSVRSSGSMNAGDTGTSASAAPPHCMRTCRTCNHAHISGDMREVAQTKGREGGDKSDNARRSADTCNAHTRKGGATGGGGEDQRCGRGFAAA
eukprot:360269-Chlamydomonas_euryale.AAC.9